jgi:hypothetical protein
MCTICKAKVHVPDCFDMRNDSGDNYPDLIGIYKIYSTTVNF